MTRLVGKDFNYVRVQCALYNVDDQIGKKSIINNPSTAIVSKLNIFVCSNYGQTTKMNERSSGVQEDCCLFIVNGKRAAKGLLRHIKRLLNKRQTDNYRMIETIYWQHGLRSNLYKTIVNYPSNGVYKSELMRINLVVSWYNVKIHEDGFRTLY